MLRVLICCLSALAPALAQAAVRADLQARVQALLEEERVRGETPGMVVAVVADGRIAAAAAAGLADREAAIPATLDTVFPAASVSKLLTATLVLRQVERGRLDLDTPANAYLAPERWIRDAQGNPVAASLRSLLTHTAGLPVSWQGIDIPAREPARGLAEHLAQGLRTIRPPGEKIVYANDGYALLGYLAAAADGQDFETHAQEVLLDPLGMTSSSFTRPPALTERLSAAYGGLLGGTERTQHAGASAAAPAGALITTARDLARFAQLHLAAGTLDGARILSPGSVAEMMRLQARAHRDLDEGYGLGFLVRERAGRKLVWHDGDLPGAAARLALLPARGIAVAVLSNRPNHEPVNVLARRILELFTGPEAEPDALPDVAALEPFVGVYRPLDMVDPELGFLELLFNARIRAAGSALELQLGPGGAPARLEPLGGAHFRIRGGILDDSSALFSGDRLYAGFVEARRLEPWETARAFVAYAALLALLLLIGLVLLVVRSVRSMRARRA